jgi:hypothetical protein
MAKATHRGHCQACGAFHKVNAKTGGLAQHGYTTKWGFFSGTCSGSNWKPIEVSSKLIEVCIEEAIEHHAKLSEDADKVEAGTAGKFVYIKMRNYDGSPDFWVRMVADHGDEIEVESTPRYRGRFNSETNVRENPRFAKRRVHSYFGNEKYVRYLRSRAQEVDQYLAWQRDRLANWTPGELEPITD